MVAPDTVLRLVGLAYDAVAAPEKWRPFLQQLALEAGAQRAALLTRGVSSSGTLTPFSVAPGLVASFGAAIGNERWPPNPAAIRAGQACIVAEPLAGVFAEAVLTPVCDDGCSKGCLVGVAYGARTPPGVAADARDLLLAVAPYLRRVLDLRDHVTTHERFRGAAAAALDRLSLGVVFLDHRGTVLMANDVAAQILRESATVRVHQGRLSLREPADDARFQRAISGVARGVTSDETTLLGSFTGAREGRRALEVRLFLFARGAELSHRGDQLRFVALLRVRDAAPAIDLCTLARVYKLTQAEARVAAQLANGQSVKDIAKQSRVSVPTLRTHLHRVFSKTGASRQADLVRMLLMAFTTFSD